jgi:arylsulfatase A-like enzyme
MFDSVTRRQVGFLAILAGLLVATVAAADRPNIVVILADDFGYGSAACCGGVGLRTPHLDRLAREGRRFTHAYSPGSVCSPTRYALLTGRYYWRTTVKDGEVLPGNAPLHIEPGRLTLASLCEAQGYRTAVVGKWHLGLGSQRRTDWNAPLRPGPREVGFDYFFGLGSNPWTGPHGFIENHELVGRIAGARVEITTGATPAESTTSGIAAPWQETEIMKTLTDRAVAWLEQRREQPFFLYFAPNAVHRPVAPNPRFRDSQFGGYGDFIQELDWSVGQILDTLDRLQMRDNTLVVFTSDNGGVVNRRVEETARALDAGLAVNGALRGGKHDIWEGGFRVPYLVRWPGRVPPGTTSDQLICHTDLLATLAGVLQVPLAAGCAEDSFDLQRAFTEPEPGPAVRDHVILQAADATYAVRMGDWKFIERVGAPAFEYRNRNAAQKAEKAKRKAPSRNELFDLKADPAETRNLADTHADTAARLGRRLAEARDRGATRPGAIPLIRP